jgi:hypothetical protein
MGSERPTLIFGKGLLQAASRRGGTGGLHTPAELGLMRV